MENKPENLNFGDFIKFDMRVGTITSIEEIPNSKKLIKLEVNFGPLGKRTILAGLAPLLKLDTQEGPGTFLKLGQRVVAILNLAPRKMMGIESQGMILASHDSNNKIHLVNINESISDGSEIG